MVHAAGGSLGTYGGCVNIYFCEDEQLGDKASRSAYMCNLNGGMGEGHKTDSKVSKRDKEEEIKAEQEARGLGQYFCFFIFYFSL